MDVVRFKHSGDIGDAISSMCAVKEYCEKNKVLAEIHLDKTGGAGDKYVARHSPLKRTKLNEESAAFLKPLLERQPYVKSVVIDSGNDYDVNLNEFRRGFLVKEVSESTNNNLMFL